MYIADTCSLIAYFQNDTGTDTQLIESVLDEDVIFLSPVVITEILSAATQSEQVEYFLQKLRRIPFQEGFWERAGALRRQLRAQRLKANLADCLIAQSCIDHDATLITRDRDFRHYVALGGLKVA